MVSKITTNKLDKINELVFSDLSRVNQRNTLSLSVSKLVKSVMELMNKKKKVVEQKNLELMFANLYSYT